MVTLFNVSPWFWISTDNLEISPAKRPWFWSSNAEIKYWALPLFKLVLNNSELGEDPEPML